MANIADIVVKKADNTTDITYNAVLGASGDNQAALWAVRSASGKQNFRPSMSMIARGNAARTMRRITVKTLHPVVANVAGVDTVTDVIMAETTYHLPMGVDDALKGELVAQHNNVLAAVNDQVVIGYSFT